MVKLDAGVFGACFTSSFDKAVFPPDNFCILAPSQLIPQKSPGSFTDSSISQSKFADLHVHTRASDGLMTPEEAVEQAHSAGLVAISIADHDSIWGIEPALEAGEKYGIEVIPGVELSSEVKGSELHFLGYYIDWRKKWFREKLLMIQEARRDRARKMVEKLRKLGLDVSYDMVTAIDGKVLGRPHIARVLMDRGYVKTMDEAFNRFLGRGKPAYVAKFPISPAEAIKMIKRVKGIPVLSHPVFAHADDMLPELAELGLRGIEVYHSKHDTSTTKYYEQLAQKYGLLIVGGSDSHGSEIPVGNVRIPYSLVEKLKMERDRK
jgi:hypothetical protein